MNDSYDSFWDFVKVAFALLAFVLGFATGASFVKNGMRLDAVKHGAAQWVAGERGNPEFQWKGQP